MKLFKHNLLEVLFRISGFFFKKNVFAKSNLLNAKLYLSLLICKMEKEKKKKIAPFHFHYYAAVTRDPTWFNFFNLHSEAKCRGFV